MTQNSHDVTQWAVIYCRVSTKEQTKNLSLDTQLKTCAKYCRQESYGIAEVFSEKGESAKTADRTELKKLLDYCRNNKGHVHVVVVYSLSRFARDQYSHAMLRMVLGKLGVTLRSATEAIDDSTFGRAMEGIISVFAQLDNDLRADRTSAGMKAALEAGRWPFRPPLGYLRDAATEVRSSMLPDPERALLITKVFEVYATGRYSKLEVRNLATGWGLRMPNGKPLSKQTFDKLLKNEIYAGWMVSKKWGVRYRGNHTPLISEQTFAKVQALVSGRRNALTPHVRNHPDFALRGFVKCAKCGTPLTGSWSTGRSKKYAYYRCQKGCKGTNVRKGKLEKLFVQYLEGMKPRQEYLSLFRAVVLDVWEEKKTFAADQVRDLGRRMEQLEAKRNRLEDMFLFKRAIDEGTYLRQHDRIQQDIALAEMESHDAKIDAIDMQGLLDYTEHILLSLGRQWLDCSLDQRQRLQKVLFPSGATFADGEFGTAETCLLFKLLPQSEEEDNDLVHPEGLEPSNVRRVMLRSPSELAIGKFQIRPLGGACPKSVL